MAAQDAVMLENHTKLFVETKVGEEVSLQFSTGCIYVRPANKCGSTTLGAFWARVIQSYFPPSQFTYKKSYSRSQGSQALMTVADDHAITVYLRTGLLAVEADVMWFKVIFKKLMQHYDRLTHSKPIEYFSDQCVFGIRKEIQLPEKETFDDERSRPEIIDQKLALVSSDVQLPQIDDRFVDESYADDIPHRCTDMQLVHQPSTELSLPNGSSSMTLRDGATYVYPMWKQLLNKWLNIEDCKVYLCSKHVDAERLKTLTALAYKCRLNNGLEAVYTDAVTANGQKMSAVKDSLLQGRTIDEQLFIEYRIFNKIKYGATKIISCNFIAGVHSDGCVELMVTSASFDSDGFDKTNNLHTVTLTKMSTNEFQSNFVDKLATL